MSIRVGGNVIGGNIGTDLLATKTDLNLSNSTAITNCITEIPQDIKLELNNGTLTLKAGSSAYMPDGFESDGTTPKFKKVTSTVDISYTPTWGAGYQCFINGYVNESGTLYRMSMCRGDLQFSGPTAPTATIDGIMWYDTTTNKIKTWRNNAWHVDTISEPRCLYLGIVIVGDGNIITSIDQVFNGFGYIGSTVFALPGVKGLIPNGRNEDGSLKNIEITVQNIVTYERILSQTSVPLWLQSDGSFLFSKGLSYDEKLNLVLTTNTSNPGTLRKGQVLTADLSSGVISNFTPKTAFHALDYNDSSTISGWSMPSSRYIDLTLGASGASYTAPANGWVAIRKAAGASGNYLTFTMVNTSSNDWEHCVVASTSGSYGYIVPVKKGDNFKMFYTFSGTTNYFRFYYTEGEQ